MSIWSNKNNSKHQISAVLNKEANVFEKNDIVYASLLEFNLEQNNISSVTLFPNPTDHSTELQATINEDTQLESSIFKTPVIVPPDLGNKPKLVLFISPISVNALLALFLIFKVFVAVFKKVIPATHWLAAKSEDLELFVCIAAKTLLRSVLTFAPEAFSIV